MKKKLDYIREHNWTMLLLGILVGLIISASSIYAATLVDSVDVVYDNTSSTLSSANVQDALDELYGKCNLKFTANDIYLGDYVSYTPSSTSYTTDTDYTGYTSTQTIDPSELNLWRVIAINTDGTVDIISEYVSSVSVYFRGLTGYLNLVGYLNVLASQYENSTYTSGSRYFGYNGQTEYITDTSKFTTTAPWTSSTGDETVESQGGGDRLYKTDYNLVYSVLGTRVATNSSGTSKAYWIASRYYSYVSSSTNGIFYYWNGRYMSTSGSAIHYGLYGYYPTSSSSFLTAQYSLALRPIVTLKSGLTYSGSGTEDDPYTLSTE